MQWLADRPPVQEVLAQVLGIPRSRIGELAGPALGAAEDPRRRLRLDDLPYASPLDLAEEALPPGIPELVQTPGAWKRLWWVAPSGSGRSLAGAWLSVRKLATWASVRDFSEASQQRGADRPLFVEAPSPDAVAAFVPTTDAVCVAAPRAPTGAAAGGWKIIASPAPPEFGHALVRWAALRLPRDGHFVPELAERWLDDAASRGIVEGLGTALGFLGLMDAYGTPELEKRGIARMANRFVRDRLAEVQRNGTADPSGLGESCMEILGGISRRLLTDSGTAWEMPRPFDEWLGLVPREYQGSLDVEWMRASLERTKHPPTVRELEKAVEALPPGSFRIVRALEQAGILRPKWGSEGLSLAPRWLARHLIESAKAEIAEGGAGEWSEALVSPHAAGPTAQALLERAISGDLSLLEDALERSDGRDPTSVAALEGAFRAAGLATLSGAEIPADLALALWDRQIALVVELDDGPHPRLGYAAGVAEEQPILDVGTFRLAALALSESLPSARGLHHAALRPWLDAGSSLATAVLDSIWAVVRRLDVHTVPWASDAYALADRLRDAREDATRASQRAGKPRAQGWLEPGAVHALEWPRYVLSSLAKGPLAWRDVARAHPDAILALFAMAVQDGVGIPRVAAALWEAWAAAPEPLHDESPLSPASPHARTLYTYALPAALDLLFAEGFVTRERVPYELLGEGAWRAVIGARTDAVSGVQAAWVHMPPAILREALLAATPTTDDLRGAWARAPEVVLGAVDDALDRDDPLAMNLLSAAPAERTEEIVSRLEQRLLGATWLRRQQTLDIRRWLAARIANRTPGWRVAFDFLSALG